MNLLAETLEAIREAGRSTDDVLWVGSSDGNYAIGWDCFAAIANVDYDDGFGAQEVASDLVVVFGDRTWLNRDEYDGSEQWILNKPPELPADAKPFDVVTVGQVEAVGWETLRELQERKQ